MIDGDVVKSTNLFTMEFFVVQFYILNNVGEIRGLRVRLAKLFFNKISVFE